ncbi:hypothetical protein F5Y12DRAFT_728034 [Xylaria sp. FL1777]|nr:hypothetical protein F5Y12DRAFT_728034 [Xylaria sp. FL1777]
MSFHGLVCLSVWSVCLCLWFFFSRDGFESNTGVGKKQGTKCWAWGLWSCMYVCTYVSWPIIVA